MYSTMSSANSDSFTSFPLWNSFISFYCMISLARTSKTMLNKNGECKVPAVAHQVRDLVLSL